MKILQSELEAYSPLLEQRHGYVSEYPVVREGRVSVHRIGILYRQGISGEEIVQEHYPQVTLAEVFAALSCFCANEALFHERLEAEDEESERLANEQLLARVGSV